MVSALRDVHPGVRLWLVDLDQPDPADSALLSADESARAARLVFERHRLRFIAGRAALRRILAAELGVNPVTLTFRYSAAGKPSLDGGASDVHFNLSHSEQWALVAVTCVGAVGVDIERRRPLADVLRLARTAFSDAEVEELSAVSPTDREDAFFHGWTRKEAYLKARGDKLSLADFDVSLTADRPQLLRVSGDPAEPSRWTLTSFVPVAGYAAALCVEGITSSADRT